MKKLLTLLLSFSFYSYASAGVLSNEMGQSVTYGWLGLQNSVSATNTDVNAAFSFNVSGTAYGVRFVSPVTQTSASLTVYVYLAAKTGTPTDTQMDVYPGPAGADDPQRPGTSGVLGTVTAVDLSGVTAPAWVTYTVASVSLTAGQTYWLVFSNNTGTQASNFPSYRSRALNLWQGQRLTGWLTTNGFTTDPVQQGSNGTEVSVVMKFSDGTLMGHPYVLSTAHASNTNDRGVRFKFSTAMKVYGVNVSQIPTGATTMKVYQGSTQIDSVSLDLSERSNPSTQAYYFSTVLTWSANTNYDVMFTGTPGPTTTFNRYDAGPSPPADVASCMLANQSYMDGTVPGSYTATAGTGNVIIMPDSFVPAAGGGGTVMSVFGQ